jgi:ABC-type phosphate transport system ATPase subunit
MKIEEIVETLLGKCWIVLVFKEQQLQQQLCFSKYYSFLMIGNFTSFKTAIFP